MVFETEIRLKGEYELIIKDLTKQLEFKTQDVERLKQEKEESIVNFNGKIATLQESVRYHQDANNKRTFSHSIPFTYL